MCRNKLAMKPLYLIQFCKLKLATLPFAPSLPVKQPSHISLTGSSTSCFLPCAPDAIGLQSCISDTVEFEEAIPAREPMHSIRPGPHEQLVYNECMPCQNVVLQVATQDSVDKHQAERITSTSHLTHLSYIVCVGGDTATSQGFVLLQQQSVDIPCQHKVQCRADLRSPVRSSLCVVLLFPSTD